MIIKNPSINGGDLHFKTPVEIFNSNKLGDERLTYFYLFDFNQKFLQNKTLSILKDTYYDNFLKIYNTYSSKKEVLSINLSNFNFQQMLQKDHRAIAVSITKIIKEKTNNTYYKLFGIITSEQKEIDEEKEKEKRTVIYFEF